MLRSLGSSCAVALSHLRTQLGTSCNSWRIYSFLMLPQERYRRFSDSYNDGCEIFVAFFFLVGRLFASPGDQMRMTMKLMLQGEVRNVKNIANR